MKLVCSVIVFEPLNDTFFVEKFEIDLTERGFENDILLMSGGGEYNFVDKCREIVSDYMHNSPHRPESFTFGTSYRLDRVSLKV